MLKSFPAVPAQVLFVSTIVTLCPLLSSDTLLSGESLPCNFQTKKFKDLHIAYPGRQSLLWLTIAVSLAFALILWPFFGAVLWGVVLAIVFAPLYRRLVPFMRQRRTLAALATLLIILVMVILPLTCDYRALVQEATGVYERIQSGELNFGRYFQQVFDALPAWAANLLDRFGLTNLGDVQERLSAGLMKGSQFLASQAINIGQNTFNFILSLFVMLYLLFFLLRDGDELSGGSRTQFLCGRTSCKSFSGSLPSSSAQRSKAQSSLPSCRALLGGLIFWFLGISAPLLWGA